MSRSSLAGAYFLVQGVVVAAWWAALLALPDLREWFFGADLEHAIQNSFILPDIVILGVCSAAAGLGVIRRSKWAGASAWLVTGAFLYASLLSYPLVASGYLTLFSAILMSIAAGGSGLAAWGGGR